jgi:DHA2 family multidrug resistance protein
VLWAQSLMSLSANKAGLATGWTGVTALFVAPVMV